MQEENSSIHTSYINLHNNFDCFANLKMNKHNFKSRSSTHPPLAVQPSSPKPLVAPNKGKTRSTTSTIWPIDPSATINPRPPPPLPCHGPAHRRPHAVLSTQRPKITRTAVTGADKFYRLPGGHFHPSQNWSFNLKTRCDPPRALLEEILVIFFWAFP